MAKDKEKEDISVVFCTRDKDIAKKTLIPNIMETKGDCDIKIECIVNADGMSLTKIYSSILANEEDNNDIVLFIHDDIEFLRPGWGSELIRLFNENPEYGIIGVAGSAEFDERAAWWTFDRKFGQVLHRHDGKSWLTQFSPLLEKDLEEVCVIDGLFIAVKKSRLSEDFNVDIEGFDFYDIDFCLANFLDGNCKVGVTTNIRIAHNSVGELKDSWYENREIVNNIFGDFYPIVVEKRLEYGDKWRQSQHEDEENDVKI